MSIDLSGGHPDMDYKEHRKTYAGFIRASVLIIVLIATLLVGMAMTLV